MHVYSPEKGLTVFLTLLQYAMPTKGFTVVCRFMQPFIELVQLLLQDAKEFAFRGTGREIGGEKSSGY